ncbi:sodium/pantothenate symporter [Desulfoplanes formicivorans]|uniref:Sodium:pantothenate symporter n=1 Tax=Desulfoplanes formicivorans TaxID=1592317 RepID=A0A194AEQ1_9BACT|nr:sodium/pantothenate symporter [Desulfoplanes formicivorans]GAU07670.1 sodium:pantothenate symporter [Desulfoplanes formicivorans]
MTVNLEVLIPLGIYLIFVYLLAVYANRVLSRSGNFLQEYFIGSRSMNGIMLAMTLVATYISASSFVGGPGVAYKMGLGWVLLAMIQVPTAWLTLGVLGKKFAIVARRIDAVTINDFLWARYENRAVVILATLSLVIFFIAAMVAQFIGGARLFETATGLPYHVGLTIFAVTVILYTTLGGFRAVVLTDVVQGIVMLLGTAALFVGIVNVGGGMTAIVQKMQAIDPGLITPFGPKAFLAKPFILSFWVLVCFGVIGLPHTAVRCFSYRDSRSMHTAIVVSTFVLGFLVLGMHLCGALGRAIIPDLTVGDKIMPALSLAILPPVVAGIFLAGPLAAIMSTIDSQLILASATLIRDLAVKHIPMQQPADDSRLHKLSFYCTALLGIIVFMASLRPPDLIVWINLFAFGGMQATFLWPVVLGLYWKRANAQGALCSMMAGLATYFAMVIWVKRFMGMHVIVPTLAISLIAFVVVSMKTREPRKHITRIFFQKISQ